MTEKEKRARNLSQLLDFVANAPVNEEIIRMDCNDHCEELAALADKVANGAEIETVLPELKEHMKYWGDCREEFIALVAVLKAEMMGELPDLDLEEPLQPNDSA